MHGVDLSPAGTEQVARLVELLAPVPLRAVYSSPLDRAVGTATPLAERHGLAVEICEDLQEIDYGDWTGRTIDELRGADHWNHWNANRSTCRVPNGETMIEAQGRVVTRLLRMHEQHPEDHIALVSHADVIKAALAYCLGIALDLFQRIEISPASVSVVAVGSNGPTVRCVNNSGSFEELFPRSSEPTFELADADARPSAVRA
jgi:probable phosphoglycerate mutase